MRKNGAPNNFNEYGFVVCIVRTFMINRKKFKNCSWLNSRYGEYSGNSVNSEVFPESRYIFSGP
jgi:hypothetical protein